jgi:hypothetical protein
VLDPLNLSSASFSLPPSVFDNSKEKGHTVNSIPNDFPKHCVFIRQFIRFIQRKEELRGICVPLAGICHSYKTSTAGQLDLLMILSRFLLSLSTDDHMLVPRVHEFRITPHPLLRLTIITLPNLHHIPLSISRLLTIPPFK